MKFLLILLVVISVREKEVHMKTAIIQDQRKGGKPRNIVLKRRLAKQFTIKEIVLKEKEILKDALQNIENQKIVKKARERENRIYYNKSSEKINSDSLKETSISLENRTFLFIQSHILRIKLSFWREKSLASISLLIKPLFPEIEVFRFLSVLRYFLLYKGRKRTTIFHI